MSSKLKILFLFLLTAELLIAQPANFLKTFSATTTYSGSGGYVLQYNFSQGICTLSPASFIVGGFYGRGGSLGYNDTMREDGYLIKNMTNGLTKWFRKYHLPKRRMILNDLAITYNSEILAGGTSNNQFNQLNPDGILLRTDSNGYFKAVNRFPNQAISAVTLLNDKKIAILVSDSNLFLKLVLLDKDCNVIWSKRLFHTDRNCCSYKGYKLIEGKNKSLLVLGTKYIGNPFTYTSKPFVLLSDSSGNKINDAIFPIGGLFLSAINNFDEGFYLVGTGSPPNTNTYICGYFLKLTNQLQVNWFNLNSPYSQNVEFTDLILYKKNIVSISNRYIPPSGYDRTGQIFADSTGILRKSFLFNPPNTVQYPLKMSHLQDGKVLFSLHSNAGRSFGVTDTMSPGFCTSDTLTWTTTSFTGVAQYNNISLIDSPFTGVRDTAYVYTPVDAQLLYLCSSGPEAPLDSINYPPILSTALKDPTTNKKEDRSHFCISPNPVTDYMTITSSQDDKIPVEVSVFNTAGMLVRNEKLFNTVFPFKFKMAELPTGMYILRIKTSNGEVYNDKFIASAE